MESSFQSILNRLINSKKVQCCSHNETEQMMEVLKIRNNLKKLVYKFNK